MPVNIFNVAARRTHNSSIYWLKSLSVLFFISHFDLFCFQFELVESKIPYYLTLTPTLLVHSTFDCYVLFAFQFGILIHLYHWIGKPSLWLVSSAFFPFVSFFVLLLWFNRVINTFVFKSKTWRSIEIINLNAMLLAKC